VIQSPRLAIPGEESRFAAKYEDIMEQQDLVSTIFLIFFGAAALSTVALFFRQSTLVAYMLLGMIAGPWGLKLLGNLSIVSSVGDVGIIFLLFLLGLHLPVQKLVIMLKKIASLGVISSIIFLSSVMLPGGY
jgi:Kef-type K+ transport system membrane component KefB